MESFCRRNLSLSEFAKEISGMLCQGSMDKATELLMKLTAIHPKLVSVHF